MQRVVDGLEQTRLPSASLLYDARITIDMACMLWAREQVFTKSSKRNWIIHLRADSSPQFGRDYLVIQADIVKYGTSPDTTEITKRLLPIQCVGSRSAGADHKLKKLVWSLTLESEHVTLRRTCNCKVLTLP